MKAGLLMEAGIEFSCYRKKMQKKRGLLSSYALVCPKESERNKQVAFLWGLSKTLQPVLFKKIVNSFATIIHT